MDAAAVAEAKAYLRLEHGREDALIGGLIEAALELCERFTGQVAIVRTVRERVAADGGWHRLAAAPVRAVTAVLGVATDGTESVLPVDAYAIDIDGDGRGWVRIIDAHGAARVVVAAQAGLAVDWAGLPAGVRQGAVRLAAHLHAHRDGADDAGPPAAVAALWRPYRRMRLS